MQFQAVCETLLRNVTDVSAGPRSCSFETPLHSVLFKWAGERWQMFWRVPSGLGGFNRLLQIQTICSERKLTSLFWNHTGSRRAAILAKQKCSNCCYFEYRPFVQPSHGAICPFDWESASEGVTICVALAWHWRGLQRVNLRVQPDTDRRARLQRWNRSQRLTGGKAITDNKAKTHRQNPHLRESRRHRVNSTIHYLPHRGPRRGQVEARTRATASINLEIFGNKCQRELCSKRANVRKHSISGPKLNWHVFYQPNIQALSQPDAETTEIQ